MKERGLELSPEKTLITDIEHGFDCLGQHGRKDKENLLITPSQQNVKACLENIRKLVKDDKQPGAGHLIAQLNPKIRGWANYHHFFFHAEDGIRDPLVTGVQTCALPI